MGNDDSPLLVIWETNRACDPACSYCQASAAPRWHSSDLTAKEGIRLLEEIRSLGGPLMVFTGGDPLKRPDLFQLLQKSVALGLRTHISPGVTPLLTSEVVKEFKNLGVARMDLSLDVLEAGEKLDRTVALLDHARDIGLEAQLLTTVTERNLYDLYEIADLAERAKVRAWSLLFLPVTPHAPEGDDLTSQEYGQVFDDLYQIAQRASFPIHTTEGMHYRRLAGTRHTTLESPARGFAYISHSGEIHPSAFLPVSAGNVRYDKLGEVYRNSSLFRILHEAGGHLGPCGGCRFRKLCPGSRAWAYAMSSDDLVEDDRAVYQPRAASLLG